MNRIDSLREEIARDNGIHICVDKRAPRYRRLVGWGYGSRRDARVAENRAHGRGPDPKPPSRENRVRAPRSPGLPEIDFSGTQYVVPSHLRKEFGISSEVFKAKRPPVIFSADFDPGL